MVASADTVTMFTYSARMNIANFSRRVLGVEAADQLALGLGQVERGAVGLADHRDHVDQEGGQQQEDVPEVPLRARSPTCDMVPE